MKLLKYIKAWFNIPWGLYCYDWRRGKRKYCPYHSIDESREYQENGYCSYLEMGDWEIGQDEDVTVTSVVRDHQDNEVSRHVRVVKGKDLDFSMTLLWDSCKECNIKTKKLWSRW